MSWLMGAGIGFLRGGPLGAVVGGTIQHLITKKAEKKVKRKLPGVIDETAFVFCIVVVMTKLAMAKGRITADDIQSIHKFFAKNLGYEGEDFKFINNVMDETCRVDPDLKPVLEKYKIVTQSHYNLLLLTLAYQMALLGDYLTPDVQDGINELGGALGISYEDHDRLRKKYSLQNLKTPYSVLGITEKAGDDEIKKSYRQLAAKYHPDKVAHLGDDHVEEAHIRFLEIQAAYQELEKVRNL